MEGKVVCINKNNVCNISGIDKMKNQLFKVVPSYEFVEIVLKLFIPNGFDIYYQFLREDIITKNILIKIKISFFVNNFKKYYLPCKYRKYFDEINEKKVITILRQLVKIYGYNVISKEKYERGNKYLVYNLIKTHKINFINKKEKKNILYFD